MRPKNGLSAKIMLVTLALVFSHWSFAASSYKTGGEVIEDPSAVAMATDLVVVRPVMLGITVIGSAVWLVGLPFSAAGGNIVDSADTLVAGPAMNTFVRCLGCTKAGYQRSIEGAGE